MKKIFFALTVACALAISAAAHGSHDGKKHDTKKTTAKGKAAQAKFEGKGDGVETCPVTGEPITNKDVKAQMFGRTVYFCCAGCLEDAKKNPAMYVKKTHKEQLVAIKGAKPTEHGDHHAMAQDKSASGEAKFLGKGDGIETCPVTGEPVNKNLKHEADGQTFYVCCDGCADTVKKNPAAYLKKASK